MIETYPFFREEDERTQAVIGEHAIVSDLEGSYQKPYAVLTQKRLYCKTAHGNFIINSDNVLSAGITKKALLLECLLWIAFFIDICFFLINLIIDFRFITVIIDPFWSVVFPCIITVCSLLIFLCLIIVKHSGDVITCVAAAFLCVGPIVSFLKIRSVMRGFRVDEIDWAMMINQVYHGREWIFLIPILLVVIYIVTVKVDRHLKEFQINCSTTIFTFAPIMYSSRELKNFVIQLKVLKDGEANVR